MQAACLRVKLNHLNKWNNRRKIVSAFYLESLINISEVIQPHVPDWSSPIWHIFPIRHPNRNDHQQYLKNKGIETLIHCPLPPHLASAYAEMGFTNGASPIAEEIAGTELRLPIRPHLGLDDAKYVVEIIRSYK